MISISMWSCGSLDFDVYTEWAVISYDVDDSMMQGINQIDCMSSFSGDIA